MSPLAKRHHATITDILSFLGKFMRVCISSDSSEVMCQDCKVFVPTVDTVFDPHWWSLPVVLESCLCCSVNHSVNPDLRGLNIFWLSEWRGSTLCYLRSHRYDSEYIQKTCVQVFLRKCRAILKFCPVLRDKHTRGTWSFELL